MRDTLERIAAWFGDDDRRRLTIQPSITPGMYLVRLEFGDQGHGAARFYGKAESTEDAVNQALDRWEVSLRAESKTFLTDEFLAAWDDQCRAQAD